MSMSIRDAVEAFCQELIQVEVTKLLPAAVHAVPGVAGMLLGEALQLGPVQAKIAELETRGVDFLISEAAMGLSGLEELVLTHVHGRLGVLLRRAADEPMPSVPLSADQVRALAPLVAAGKLDQLLEAGRKLLGL